MGEYRWNSLKSRRLKKLRGVSFEEIIKTNVVGVRTHPTRVGQKLMLFEYRRYVWAVPFVEHDDEIFLKTLYPSRYWTRKYERGEL